MMVEQFGIFEHGIVTCFWKDNSVEVRVNSTGFFHISRPEIAVDTADGYAEGFHQAYHVKISEGFH